LNFVLAREATPKMTAKFDVRGNTVRAAVSESNVSLTDETNVNYGGTRSGEEPLRLSSDARSSPPRRPAAVTDRDPQKMDWSL